MMEPKKYSFDFGGFLLLLLLWLLLLLLEQETESSCEIKPVSIFTHTHQKKNKKDPGVKQPQSLCHSHCAALISFSGPGYAGLPCDASPLQHATEMNKMLFTPPRAKGHDGVRTRCSRVVQHPLQRGWAEGWDCSRFSGQGRSPRKPFAADAQSILPHEARRSAEAGPGGGSELSGEGEISAVALAKTGMKGREQGSLFSDYNQQQAQKFPVAVTQRNLPSERGCWCCDITLPIHAISGMP